MIVTLTTDFGLQDYYVAILKGAILSRLPTAQLLDITHQIPQHDIVKAAFIVKNAYQSFPSNTLHIISVNTQYRKESSFLLIQQAGHFFLMPDNGISTLLFEDLPQPIIRFSTHELGTSSPNQLYAKVVQHIATEQPIASLGTITSTVEQRITLQAVISPAQIRGSVIHIDNYENVIVNINRNLFDKVGEGRDFRLYFKRHDPIVKLSTHYQDVPVGEELCLFNASNYLEIAINMGRAASLLGLKIDDTIQIDFFDEDS
ncbi:MAG: SAM-dependent chlorinase/fluorinase [Bacteroidota bacterium]